MRHALVLSFVGTLTLGLFALMPSAQAVSEQFSGSVDAAGTRYVAFPVSVTRSGTISATLDWVNADANLSLLLKDPSGVVVASATTTRKPESLTFEAQQTGTWKIGVRAASGASSFQVAVEHSVEPTEPPPARGADWPMFHFDSRNSGVSPETTIHSSNVGTLSLDWQVNTGQAAYTSPAVVYEATTGKSLVYVGNSVGTMTAYDAATGERVWWFKAGAGINSSPAVVDGVVYFGASDDYFYALNARTGQQICRFFTDGIISSSPVVVDPDGSGLVAYFGDNGITGGDDGGNMWAVNAVDPNGAADCSAKWRFNSFGVPVGSHPEAGVWSSPAFITTAEGRDVVVFGSSSTDNAVYAVDAVTGQQVWRFQTEVFYPDNDVGAGPTLSPPGVNGFPQGAVYVPGKNRIVYALNLSTGAKLWEFRIRDDAAPNGGATRSTPALVGDRVVLGYGSGLYALDARTGAKVWKSTDAQEIVASPAVAGPSGSQVAFAGDFAGAVIAYDLSNGSTLWRYNTGAFIYGSPVVAAGKVFIASSNGFLYAFDLLGGSTSAKPDTTLVTPTEGQIVANPAGDLTLSGQSSDDQGVSRVLVAVKNKNTNKWWDAAARSWSPVFQQNAATLSNPGGGASSWSFAWPVPAAGGVYFAQAEGIDGEGQHDPSPSTRNFSISSLGNPPDTAITSPAFAQVFNFPTDCHCDILQIPVTGTATDSGGAKPGIEQVNVVIKNIEHGEFYCGVSGCATGGGESTSWVPTYTVLRATLANPGATTTTWSITFPTYDHPHKYRIVAWATDRDGESDQTKAVVGRTCVRDPGVRACV